MPRGESETALYLIKGTTGERYDAPIAEDKRIALCYRRGTLHHSWGHDFRPEYTQLRLLREIVSKCSYHGADSYGRQDNQTGHPEAAEYRGRPDVYRFLDRPNLSLDVKRGYSAREKLRSIVELIRHHSGESGIIYCLARKTTEELAEKLKKEGIATGVYHVEAAQLGAQPCARTILWQIVQVICATIAFGMGIDKSNVRFVVHYNLPKSIRVSIREIGRGG